MGRGVPFNFDHMFYIIKHRQHINSMLQIGSFIRHSCGAFGESGSDSNIINKVDHLFDCLEMGTGFTMADGEVTFWNR